jgi:ribose transport system substrate-binding protein
MVLRPRAWSCRVLRAWTPVTFLACAAVVALPLVTTCHKPGGEKGKDRPLRIAFVPKGTTHEFWRTIHAGAIKARRDLEAQGVKVELVWKGPLREDDRDQQVQVVESFASQGVDGIVLAPLDEKALVRPVEEAKRLGIPTVIVDSGLASDQIVSFVATDNTKGGELAADELGRLLGGKGRALLLRHQEGSASTTARERGFLARLAAAWPGSSSPTSSRVPRATPPSVRPRTC